LHGLEGFGCLLLGGFGDGSLDFFAFLFRVFGVGGLG